MSEAAASESALATEEARLARAAAAGDGGAFAALYERYAQRAYNLALRISGSDEDAADAVQEAFLSVMRRLPELGDRDLAFGSYLFTATRNATYDLMRKQQRDRPSDSIPESAVPVGAGAGGLGLDPGDPEEDPDRKPLLASQREEIRAANSRLPERQREALALRELEDLSYDEIAAQMEMNRNSVAQLISRARINLRNELRGGALASVVASSPACERALPLIAMRDDGQLDAASEDAAWLAAHLGGCERCQVATEAMQEAGVSYRAWAPVAIAPWLFEETMAKAAELVGADWSEEIAAHRDAPRRPGSLPGLPPAYRGGRAGRRPGRRALVVAAGAALLLGLGAAAVIAGGDDGSPPRQPSTEAPAAAADREAPAAEVTAERVERRPEPKPAAREKERPATSESSVSVEEGSGTPAPAPIPSGADPSPPKTASGGRGAAKLEATKPASTQPASTQPTKSQPPQAAPEPATAPVAETPTEVEEPATVPEPVEETTTEQPEREPPTEEPPREPPRRDPPGGKPPG